ncbi:putative lipoprotein [Puccinia sorghi]|uniref:Putative lipoprotein n=1 Tax=Puccinia sorghi TaxID=27349 RepID=A0A0L6UKD2_9BASI|nr:putative lipoprotein [Puccinia sorghi]
MSMQLLAIFLWSFTIGQCSSSPVSGVNPPSPLPLPDFLALKMEDETLFPAPQYEKKLEQIASPEGLKWKDKVLRNYFLVVIYFLLPSLIDFCFCITFFLFFHQYFILCFIYFLLSFFFFRTIIIYFFIKILLSWIEKRITPCFGVNFVFIGFGMAGLYCNPFWCCRFYRCNPAAMALPYTEVAVHGIVSGTQLDGLGFASATQAVLGLQGVKFNPQPRYGCGGKDPLQHCEAAGVVCAFSLGGLHVKDPFGKVVIWPKTCAHLYDEFCIFFFGVTNSEVMCTTYIVGGVKYDQIHHQNQSIRILNKNYTFGDFDLLYIHFHGF